MWGRRIACICLFGCSGFSLVLLSTFNAEACTPAFFFRGVAHRPGQTLPANGKIIADVDHSVALGSGMCNGATTRLLMPDRVYGNIVVYEPPETGRAVPTQSGFILEHLGGSFELSREPDETRPSQPAMVGLRAEAGRENVGCYSEDSPELAVVRARVLTSTDSVAVVVFRDGEVLQATLQTGEEFTDSIIRPGAYCYSTLALDLAGSESQPSSDVCVDVQERGCSSARLGDPKSSRWAYLWVGCALILLRRRGRA
jgi:hypothetical protein